MRLHTRSCRGLIARSACRLRSRSRLRFSLRSFGWFAFGYATTHFTVRGYRTRSLLQYTYARGYHGLHGYCLQLVQFYCRLRSPLLPHIPFVTYTAVTGLVTVHTLVPHTRLRLHTHGCRFPLRGCCGLRSAFSLPRLVHRHHITRLFFTAGFCPGSGYRSVSVTAVGYRFARLRYCAFTHCPVGFIRACVLRVCDFATRTPTFTLHGYTRGWVGLVRAGFLRFGSPRTRLLVLRYTHTRLRLFIATTVVTVLWIVTFLPRLDFTRVCTGCTCVWLRYVWLRLRLHVYVHARFATFTLRARWLFTPAAVTLYRIIYVPHTVVIVGCHYVLRCGYLRIIGFSSGLITVTGCYLPVNVTYVTYCRSVPVQFCSFHYLPTLHLRCARYVLPFTVADAFVPHVLGWFTCVHGSRGSLRFTFYAFYTHGCCITFTFTFTCLHVYLCAPHALYTTTHRTPRFPAHHCLPVTHWLLWFTAV